MIQIQDIERQAKAQRKNQQEEGQDKPDLTIEESIKKRKEGGQMKRNIQVPKINNKGVPISPH